MFSLRISEPMKIVLHRRLQFFSMLDKGVLYSNLIPDA